MSLVTPLLREGLIQALLAAKLKTRPQTKCGLVLYAVSGVTGLSTLVFLIYAMFLAFAMYVPPMQAALLSAACLFVLSAGAAIAAGLVTRTHRRRFAALEHRQVSSTIETALQMIAEEIEEPVSRNPKMALALATLAGLFAGRQLR